MELRMSHKERDRLKVTQQVREGKLTQVAAARLLGISERQVRRSVQRYREQGDAGLVHRSRGQPSNRKLPEQTRNQALAMLRQDKWRDFGPSFAAEKLAETAAIHVSRETVRRWMIEAGLWQPRKPKVTHRHWRERKACVGEMVQMDTSEHDWFEARGEQAVLITMIDDATSRLFMRFFPTDSTATNMTLLRDYIKRYGRPLSIYADKASHFKTTRSATVAEQLEGRQAETQIQRALRELDIEYIPAHSPQAKGRVERSFGTAQDRLVKELRLAGIGTIEAANECLEHSFMPMCNQRFTVEPACAVDAHRPYEGYDLDAILCRQERRVVANDYTIQYRNTRYQIAREYIAAGLRRAQVTVEQRLDGSIKVRYRNQYLKCHALPERPKAAEQEPMQRHGRRSAPRQGHKPAADHPWRKPFKQPAPAEARR